MWTSCDMWGEAKLSQSINVRLCLKHVIIQCLRTDLNLLEGTVDHGDEHVEQHNHHGDVVDPVQHVTDVLDEFVSVIDNDGLDLGQSKYGPEQRLEALLQAGQMDTHRRKWGGGEKRKSYFWLQANHLSRCSVREQQPQRKKQAFFLRLTVCLYYCCNFKAYHTFSDGFTSFRGSSSISIYFAWVWNSNLLKTGNPSNHIYFPSYITVWKCSCWLL